MPTFHPYFSLAILAVVAAPAMAAPGPLAGLAGHYRVAGVAVSDDGVQALSDNDPSLMGKRLTFSPARLAFDRPTATKDVCEAPTFMRLPTRTPAEIAPQLRKLGIRQPVAYAVRCRSGSWGPGDGTVYVGVAGAIAMPWYDGGVLKLVR